MVLAAINLLRLARPERYPGPYTIKIKVRCSYGNGCLLRLPCKDCGRPFTLTEGEGYGYEGKGFPLPKRCRVQEEKKEAREGKKGHEQNLARNNGHA